MREDVKNYYGEVLSSSDDLKTDACCTIADTSSNITQAISLVHPEVQRRYYGCGLIAPECLEGLKILDLGSGSGRDAYVLAQLVGETGHVTGIDMTEEQLEVANSWLDYHRDAFGYEESNVEFIKGDLERLGELGLPEGHFDLIVSNCVINLLDNKDEVLAAAFRLLKPGGEFYFSDVYSNRRIPETMREDPVLRGECLSGALYINDFETLVRQCGFHDPRIVEHRPLAIADARILEQLSGFEFASVTYRLIKAISLETSQEDFGHHVCYLGTIESQNESFLFDMNHNFETGVPRPVSANTHEMIRQSRFAQHCRLEGDGNQHRGEYAESHIRVFAPEQMRPRQPVVTPQASSGCCG